MLSLPAFIKKIKVLVWHFPRGSSIEMALKRCTIAIRKLKKRLIKTKSVEEKQKIMTTLNDVKSYRLQLKSRYRKGGKYSKGKETACNRVQWTDSLSAFKNRLRTGIITNLKHKDPKGFLVDCEKIFRRRIQNVLKNHEAVKVNTIFCGEFQLRKALQIQKEYKYFNTANFAMYKDTDISEWFNNNVLVPLFKDIEDFQQKDSGWTLLNVDHLKVNISKYTLMLGSSFIDLPPEIKKKKACINVRNDDNACFAWAVTSALYPVEKNNHRVSKYPHYSKVLKLKGIQFPMTINQIPNFEKQNDISINVYVLKKKKTFITVPTRKTENKKDKHVNLLLIQDHYSDSNSPVRYHYVWIKNLSRLVSKQLSKEKGQKFFCDRCLHYYRSKEKLLNHSEHCSKINETNEKIKMPELGQNILKFKNHKNKETVPYIIYADLESILKPSHKKNYYQEHEAAAVGYYVRCSYDNSLSFYRYYRGLDCMEWFADELNQFAEDVETVFLCPNDIDMTSQHEAEFKNATHCHICEQPFKPKDKRVRDHNHFLAENNYRGAAHNDCNLNYYEGSCMIPVVFHNLSGYDAHFVIKDIATRMKGKIDLLPITKEKYISFTKYYDDYSVNFRFLDSFRFMASSLDQLSSNLSEFPCLKSEFPNQSKENINLLMKKGVMPYDYIDSIDRFNEKSLPPIEAFYNKLEEKICPRRTYMRAQLVWDQFNCKNLGDYSDLYMKTDILLLADVFENFRSSCQITYGLDPAHYFTLSGYTWDAMLKYTKQELELLTDYDMFLFVERGIRGGLSQVCGKRRAHANNKYLPNYNPKKPQNYLMYFDVNNQYGWAMSQYLPYGGFQWADTNIDVTQITDDSPQGYILEVDLEYPRELHDLHKDLPLCPEHYSSKNETSCAASNSKDNKLMATLHPKMKYIIHYRNLKQALRNGLILTKIHRVLKFKQCAWLKSYIDLNTNLRKNAKNEFEKNLFKLMNNAVFGKTMENVRKRVDVRLLTKWKGRYGVEAYISKAEFKNCVIFNENLVAVELRKIKLFLNKPIYIGMSILDMAKTTIYDFHYDYMKYAFEDCNVLYTDTDSLIYEMINNPYEVMRTDCHKYFDTSDYPKDNPYGIPQVNMKVLGMMKDENNGIPMSDYVGLRSKMYVVKNLKSDLDMMKRQWEKEEYEADEIESLSQNNGVTKKVKGVKKSVVKNNICFEDFIACLETRERKIVSQNLIHSKNHHVSSIVQQKVALSPEDDKRYLVPGSFDTLPWGHYSIDEIEERNRNSL